MGFDTGLTRAELLRGMAGGLALGWLSGASAWAQTTGSSVAADDLKVFEKWLGLNFSDAERKAALAEVRSNLDATARLKVPYSSVPATVFQPYASAPLKSARDWKAKLPKAVRPDSEEELAFLPMLELAALIRARKISSLELTQLYLKRLKLLNPELNCVVTLNEAGALREAKQCDEDLAKGRVRSIVHGVPYVAKDLFSTKGLPTTWGAEPFKDQLIDEDAAVIERLREAGAVLLAKVTLGALAMDDKWFGGQTKNPWNPKQGSSGSSAGSACAAAAGLCGFAIGTETLGSIISPSHRCRVTGLRPSFGRISRAGAMALSWTMDKVGPITRTAQDALLVLQVLHGEDPHDPSSVTRPLYDPSKVDLNKLRVGILDNGVALDETEGGGTSWLAAVRELGIEPKKVKFEMPADATLIGLSVEAAAMFDTITRDGRINQMSYSQWGNIFRSHRYFPAVEYVQSLRARHDLMLEFDRQMRDFDVVLAADRGGQLLFTTNLTGHPQLYVPHENATGFSIIGQLYREDQVCALGWAVQQKTGVFRQRPKM